MDRWNHRGKTVLTQKTESGEMTDSTHTPHHPRVPSLHVTSVDGELFEPIATCEECGEPIGPTNPGFFHACDPYKLGKRSRPIAPGSICDLHGCQVVHPGTTHAHYDARYDHARSCPTCTVNYGTGPGECWSDVNWYNR